MLTVLPATTRGQRPFGTSPVSTLASFVQRAIEGLAVLHGSIGPPSAFARFPRPRRSRNVLENRQTCFPTGPYGPQEILRFASPFGGVPVAT